MAPNAVLWLWFCVPLLLFGYRAVAPGGWASGADGLGVLVGAVRRPARPRDDDVEPAVLP